MSDVVTDELRENLAFRTLTQVVLGQIIAATPGGWAGLDPAVTARLNALDVAQPGSDFRAIIDRQWGTIGVHGNR